MEAEWVKSRSELRTMLREHPTWSSRTAAEQLRRSVGWVKKWKNRFKESQAEDEQVLRSRSRRRHRLPALMDTRVEAAILDIRDHPPAGLNRIAGARTIVYYLQQREDLRQTGLRLPTSSSTIWKVLRRFQRIAQPRKRKHQALEAVAPMQTWEMDFTDVPTIPVNPDGKQGHVVETLNIVDVGTSILVDCIPDSDYHAQSALLGLISVFDHHGLPERLRMNRDPRFIGSWTAQNYPSALMRFLMCLKIEVEVCPPRRPDLKPFVERFNRTLEYECFWPEYPTTLAETRSLLKQFYNRERPHQGRNPSNQPPPIAFPAAQTTRRLPLYIDPDQWLKGFHTKTFTRRISPRGTVDVGR